MADPFLGEIKMFGGNFAPNGWALCNGQLLAIAQNTALFALLGTQYGGNGTTTFALPDLRGRAPVHFGQGPGLSLYDIGQTGGAESVTLSVAQLPPHGHDLHGSTRDEETDRTDGALNAHGGIYANGPPDTTMGPAVGATGGGQGVDVRSPYLGVNFIIALVGIFPSRA